MRRKTYRVTFTGYGSMNSKYSNQSLEVEIRHDWGYSEQDAEAVMYIIRERIKDHFRQFEIHTIEQLPAWPILFVAGFQINYKKGRLNEQFYFLNIIV